MKYQVDKLFVGDVVKVGKSYNKKLYNSIFVLKDNQFFNVVTGTFVPHSTECETSEIGCENMFSLITEYPDVLPRKNFVSEADLFEVENKLNKKVLKNDFEF